MVDKQIETIWDNKPNELNDEANINGYHQTSNICRSLVGNNLADHSIVIGASPVCAAPTTSSFST